MKKPRKITLVPANSIEQLGSAGSGHTLALPVFGEKSMRVVDFPSTTKLIMHSPGEGKSHWEGFARHRAKQGATAAYIKRVKRQTRKPKPVVSSGYKQNLDGEQFDGLSRVWTADQPKPAVSNSFQNIVAGGQFEGLVNGEPEIFSLPDAATISTRRATKIK